MRPYKTGKIKIKGSQGKNLLEWGERRAGWGKGKVLQLKNENRHKST